MILILSRQDDGNTHLVVEWLIAMGKKFVRLNSDDERTIIKGVDLAAGEILIEQNNTLLNLLDATSVWYRKKGISVKSTGINTVVYSEAVFNDAPRYHRKQLEDEMTALVEFVCFAIEPGCKILGNYHHYSVNKMKVLSIAEKTGLKVPQSYIVTNKEKLLAIMKTHGKGIITKAINEGVYLFTENFGYYSYTEKLTPHDLDKLPARFYPSLIQVEIKKKFELRVFFINDELFAMAIFSQNDSQTTVDFRKYNNKKPNRTVPFTVPVPVANNIRQLMKSLGLNTGSLDLIVDENDNYVFLEVNPVGQITMTSLPCNYYLEKKIAETL
jgi:ATP-GRASP peptide maturase of grasp-with-spasm system